MSCSVASTICARVSEVVEPMRRGAAMSGETRRRAGVDRDDRARDQAGPVRREERRQLGHLLGLTGALERGRLDQMREVLAPTGAAGQLGLDESGAQRVAADALGAVLD